MIEVGVGEVLGEEDGLVVGQSVVDEEDGIVQLRLMGACGSCPVSMLTLKQGIERRIIMAVPEVKGINAL